MKKPYPGLALVSLWTIIASCAGSASLDPAFLERGVNVGLGFAGTSLELERSGDGYIATRTLLGSGVPEIGSIRYAVRVISPSRVELGEILDATFEYTRFVTAGERIAIEYAEGSFTVTIDGKPVETTGIYVRP